MSAQNFLDRLEATGLIEAAFMAELRKRVGESKRRLRPEMIAKLLVDRGQLTAGQARKLVMDAMNAPEPSETDPEEDILTGEPLPTSSPTASSPSPNDELTLAVDEEDDLLSDNTALSLVPTEPDDDAMGLVEDDIPEADLIETDDVADAMVVVDESAGGDEQDTQDLRDLLDDSLPSTPSSTSLKRRGSSLSDLFGGGGGKSKKPVGRQRRWDSPLILLGGGGLILLIAAGAAIFSLLYSESVDEIFTAGEEAYESQAYGVAIEKFQRLVTKYPQHENASLAKVKIELAKLRKHTDASQPNWPAALLQAQQGLPTIVEEPALSDVRAELAKLLPDITSGLVDEANTSKELAEKKELVDLAEDALELVHDPVYLPTTVKSTQELRIEGIEATRDVVRRDIQRDEALLSAAEAIAKAAEEGRIVDAYSQRDDLVTKYPILLGHSTLQEALSKVAEKERAAVEVSDGTLKAETQDRPPVSRIRIVLCDRRGKTLSGNAASQVVPILARGAVYGVRGSDGVVLWRRYVGFDVSVYPQSVSSENQADLLIVDAAHSELQRVAAATGELRWRLPCPTPISTPTIVGDRAFICSGQESSSRLLAVNLSDGSVAKSVAFPVGCESPVGVIQQGQSLVVPGSHSSIYVLDRESLDCTAVIASGHPRGSIQTAPVWLGEVLMVAENTNQRTARLQPYQRMDDGRWTPSSTRISVPGRVISPPQVDDRRMLVHTDLGQIRVVELPINSGEIRVLASIEGSGKNVGPSYGWFAGSQIWIADQKLTRYQLQATRGELVSQFVRDQRDHFLNPIQTFGGQLMSVRQREGMLGVTVAAHSMRDSQGEPIWQTDLAVPSDILVGSNNEVHAVTANGAMFPIDAAAVKSGVSDNRIARIDPRLVPTAFSQAVRVSPDKTIFASPPPTSHMVLAVASPPELRRVPLRIDTDAASTSLVAFRDGILAACETGAIHMLDPASGKLLAQPFVPRLEPGQPVDWLVPASMDANRFVAADQAGKIYVINRQGNSLVASEQGELAGPLVAGLAALETVAFAVTATSGSEELLAIDEQLEVVQTMPLPGGLAWGPRRVGNMVLVGDQSHRMSALGSDGNTLWSATLPAALSGDPVMLGDQVITTCTDGTITVFDASSGNMVGQQKLPEALGGSAALYKGRLLVVGWDGTLYLVDVPKS